MVPPVVVKDLDHKAAEWVLSIGGTVRLNGQVRDIRVAADLPPGAFQLTWVDLRGNTQVSDAGLAHFEGCKSLTYLGLRKTKVTAAKIEELKKALPKCKIEWDGGVIEPKEA
jgi:eukaryotic-like serine/threonine-protein kinase